MTEQQHKPTYQLRRAADSLKLDQRRGTACIPPTPEPPSRVPIALLILSTCILALAAVSLVMRLI